MTTPASGCENHLFAGSDGGGARWVTACSLIATARLNDVEPFAYLKDLLERMTDGHPMSRLDETSALELVENPCQSLTDLQPHNAYGMTA
jgi:IS66 C-terminal element